MIQGLFILLIVLGIILELLCIVLSKKNCNEPKKRTVQNPKYGIIIPARDESRVIEGLLKSIQKQNEDMSNVHIIVESMEDPTVKIAKKYDANIFLRLDLSKNRKGFALDECIKDLNKNKIFYDLYFIFDADNLVSDNYFLEMIESYKNGYDIVISYRDTKNGNYNWISAASSLTFTMMNTVRNTHNCRCKGNAMISGTGYFISSDLIKKWNGFPFHALTEDYELTLYTINEGICTFYNDKAKIYDEQPVKFSATITQRTRWIRGYLDARKEYIPKLRKKNLKKAKNNGSIIQELIGVNQYILMVVGLLGLILHRLISLFIEGSKGKLIFEIAIIIGVIYLVLMFASIYLIIFERDKINLQLKSKIKVVFLNPIFLITYLPCLIKALTNKNIGWDRIEHNSKEVI